MSWLGKIMTFLVLIGALVWAYFTVATYVTRTNWKTRADNYQAALKESEANRLAEQRRWQLEQAEMSRLLEAEKARTTELNANYAKLAADSKAGDDKYKEQLNLASAATLRADLQFATEKATFSELKDTRDRNAKLEDDRVALVLAKETAERERLRAENEKNLQKAIAEDNGRRIETLTALVTELRQTGGSGTATVLRTIEKTPTPLPDNIRGTVLRDIAGDFVHISIGIDAGLEPGAKLDIYRETGGGQYLGTLVITKSVYPKEAVAEFRPARGVPVSQLRPDELPRKGDTVGHISTGPLGRR